MQVRMIDVNGINTRYIYAGSPDKPALLLVHGRVLSAEHWYCNIDELGKDFYVIAPDALGNGFTGPETFANEPLPLRARLKHLRAFVDALGLSSFHACGSSAGSLMCALLYLDQPSRIKKLIINGSAAFASPEKLASQIDNVLKRDGQKIASFTAEEWRAWFATYVYDTKVVPSEIMPVFMTAFAQPWVVEAWKNSLLSQVENSKTPSLRIEHRLRELDVESLLIWGREDKGAPLSDAENMLKQMPRARLKVFDKCAHMPMMEYPREYNALVRDFLKA